MTHPWDEFSKSLAESVPRRESLRRLGLVFAGAALAPLGLPAAWARAQDSCKAFCKRCPKWARSQCLAACQACNSDTSRLCGSCGSYTCCGSGTSCCGNYCVDLASNIDNCGECGYVCPQPGPNEYGACVDGDCVYACAKGAVDCNGTCTYLAGDPNNCGACGIICGGSTPLCIKGVCSSNPCIFPFVPCDGICVDPTSDPYNCGGCYIQCAPSEVCAGGFCQGFCGGCE